MSHNETLARTSEAEKSGEEKSVLVATDPEGYRIVLTTSTWEEHILIEHPEMKKHLDLMQETLESPQVIVQSAVKHDTYYYFRLTGRSFFKKDDLYLKVVARRTKKGKNGFVKTVYLQKDLGKGKVI